jgi:hypothetical protein
MRPAMSGGVPRSDTEHRASSSRILGRGRHNWRENYIAFALVVAVPVAQPQDGLFTVYVFTQTHSSGLTDANQQERLDAVKRLKQALSKKRTLRLVDERTGSDLEVEV